MKNLSLGNETIAFQNGDFFKELTIIFQDLRAQGSSSEAVMHNANLRVGQCISKHTGITVKPNDVSFGDYAFIMLPCTGRANVINSLQYSKFLAKYFDPRMMRSFKDLESKGWIDPANSRVGGAFSEIMFDMYLSHHYLLGKKYDAEEMAGIVLHEVGHAYNLLHFIADTVICNNALMMAYQELTDGKPNKQVKIILNKAADNMGIKNRDWVEAVTDDTDGMVAFRVLATAAQIEPRGMDNKTYFTQDACEELADIFAARHGAGRAILTMRAKMKLQSPSYGYSVGIGLAILGMTTAVLSAPIGLPIVALGALFTLASTSMHIETAANMPDITTFKKTATKIRNQFIEQLKQSKLPAEKVRELTESVNLADKLIQENQQEFDPGQLARFFDMFRRGKMDARASRDYTDKLEVLAANDLFLRAAQFAAR